MREVVGDRTVTEVVTIGRQEVEVQVKEQLQALTTTSMSWGSPSIRWSCKTSIRRTRCEAVLGQRSARRSSSVTRWSTRRSREYNRVIPRARGEAEQAILQAEGYALDRVNRSQGDSMRFTALYDAYRGAPNVTRQRIVPRDDAADPSRTSWSQAVRGQGYDRGPAAAASLDNLPISRGTGTTQNAGGGQWKPKHLIQDRRSRRCVDTRGREPLHGERGGTGDHHSQFGEPVGNPITRPGLHFQGTVHSDHQLLRQAVPRVGRRSQPEIPDQRQAVHLGRHLRAVADHRTLCCSFSDCRMSVALRRGWTTSSMGRRGTRSLGMT